MTPGSSGSSGSSESGGGAPSRPGPPAPFHPPEGRHLALFAEAPELAAAVPWRPLAHAPTPVEEATAAESYLGRGGVWIKRDDLISPVYGGNKVRRFEFLLADAERRGARELLTVGGLASTQVMATVLFGRAVGFDVKVVLFDQPVTSFARRAILTDVAAGAEVLYGGSYARTAWLALRAWRGPSRPYFILPGASTAMANLGYVDAMLELGEQVRQKQMPRPDVIVVPAGSGGTLAGLAVGVSILGWPTLLVGVRITELIACNRVTIRFLIENTARYLGRLAPRFTRRRLTDARVALHHDAIGEGYGHSTPEAMEAISVVERLTGTPGEITYSGKALAGLRVIGREHPEATVLYWHTLSSRCPDVSGVTPDLLPPELARLFEGDVPV